MELTEVEAQELSMSKIQLEKEFYKQVYDSRLRNFLNSLIGQSNLNIVHYFEQIHELGAVIKLTFSIRQRFESVDNAIVHKSSKFDNYSTFFDYYPHPIPEEQIKSFYDLVIKKHQH